MPQPTAAPGRRKFLQGAAFVAAAPFLNLGHHALHAATPASPATRRYSTRAIDLVKASLVIDMLAPVSLRFDFDPAAPMTEAAKVDFRRSGVTGFHHAMGIGGPEAYADALRFIATINGYCGHNPDVFALVGRVGDLDRAKREGLSAVIVGIQNSDHFRTVEDVKTFHGLGLRCSQLTYNSQNFIGSGSTDRVDGGISDFGASIVTAMNDVGVLVDVSHSGDRTSLDAVALSKTPIAFTHSNCRAISGHARAKTDEAIIALAKRGGVMGITNVRMFLSAKEPTGIDDVVTHIDHVGRLVGFDHVGIGSDQDLYGYDSLPPDQAAKLKSFYNSKYGFRDKLDADGTSQPERIFDLTEAMIRRSYSNETITAILGGNFRRLLGQTWK